MNLEERIQVASLLFEASVQVRAKLTKQKIALRERAFWKQFDDLAFEILEQYPNGYSLTKFEEYMKSKNVKVPTITKLVEHGYTVFRDSFYRIKI